MNPLSQLLSTFRSGRIGIPLLILSILAMIILPLPPLLLDILFTFNIAVAILVLLTSVSAKSPLDFSLFPTVILITTLMRLCLNVASTRVVLLDGHTGTDAAGKVIEAFGEVVIGGNFIVGMVVFMILMIVNFIVITKGGERISEVTARFTLDALPGKQMAIDADLNAGLISQEDAKQRRQQVAKEADFYGAMDGASKFVRGDAIAGILILFINLFGGFAIGMFMYDLSAGQAFQQYALLAIGDGLVAQIPALLLSTAAAIIVTRINESSEITQQVGGQLLASPSTLYTVAGYKLVGLVNQAAGAPLVQRVRGVRQTLSENLGFLLPEVHIRDSLRLKAAQYSIYINGEKIDGAEIHADRLMAIPSPELYGEIDGILGTDPAYRMPVVWILPGEKSRALNLGYQVIDCSSVIATHLNKVIRANLPDIFKHDDVDHLLQRLTQQAPKLADALKNQLSLTQQHRVYRQLLTEEVSLRDIVSIATALVEGSESTKDPVLLCADVRYALRRNIVTSIAGDRTELTVFVLDNNLENTLLSALSIAKQACPVSLDNIPVEPNLLNQLQTSMPVVKEKLRKEGHPPVLAVMPQLRPYLPVTRAYLAQACTCYRKTKFRRKSA